MSERIETPTVTMTRRQIVSGLAAGTVVALAGCVENRAIGRSQLILVDEGQLAQLSAATWSNMKKQTKVSSNRTLNRRLDTVGSKIVQAAGLTDRSWEYTVFEDDQANAFVLPGGQVGFYEGIFDRMQNDSQLATVMGHEVGHVTARHAAERYSQQMAAGVGLTAANVALAASDVSFAREAAAVLGAGVMFGVVLPYSRRHELEADRLGIDYMARAGYDPRQAVPFWQNMMATDKGPRGPEFLSTHPDPQTRIAAIRQQVQAMGYTT